MYRWWQQHAGIDMESCYYGTADGFSGLAPPQQQVVSRGLQRRILDQRRHRRKLLLVPSSPSPTASSSSSYTSPSRSNASPSELHLVLPEHGLSGTTANHDVSPNSRKLEPHLLLQPISYCGLYKTRNVVASYIFCTLIKLIWSSDRFLIDLSKLIFFKLKLKFNFFFFLYRIGITDVKLFFFYYFIDLVKM